MLAIIGMAIPGLIALGGGWVRVTRLELDIVALRADMLRVHGELKTEIEKRVPRETWQIEIEALRMQMAEIKGLLMPRRRDDTSPGT
jgi:hypothetical protein